MKSSGPYHRGNSGASGFDYCAAFIYTVLPTRTPGAALFGSTHRQSGSVSVPWLHLSAAAGLTCRPALLRTPCGQVRLSITASEID